MKNEHDSNMLNEGEGEGLVASPPPLMVEDYIKDRVKQEDTGAGIFGALNHINVGKYSAG